MTQTTQAPLDPKAEKMLRDLFRLLSPEQLERVKEMTQEEIYDRAKG